jgi:hypothetical protein
MFCADRAKEGISQGAERRKMAYGQLSFESRGDFLDGPFFLE